VAGGLIGAVASVLANRLAGVYLFVGTLGISFILWEGGNLVQSSTGQQAGYFLPVLSLFGLPVDDLSEWIWLTVVVLLVVYLYYAHLRRSRFGRVVHLLGHDTTLAKVAGIPTRAFVRLLFVISSGVTCVAGSLFAFYTRSVSYDTFNLVVSISFIVMVVLGGLGSLPGAIFGAAVVTVAPLALTVLSPDDVGPLRDNLPYLQIVAYSVIGLAILLFLPGGVSSVPRLTRAATQRLSRLRHRHPAPPAASPDPDALVSVRDVTALYGGGEVGLVRADLDVPPSGVTSVLGRNGAGKTTLLRAIAGFPPGTGGRVARGRVWTSGTDLTGQGVGYRIRRGIRLIPAEDKVFPELTVHEHLVEAVASSRRSDRTVDDILALFPDLRAKLDSRGGVLSGGERQQLALACGLAAHARLLLVDEASLGLAPVAIRRLTGTLRTLKDQTSILLVEQSASVAGEVADAVVFVHDGRIDEAEPTPSADVLGAKLLFGPVPAVEGTPAEGEPLLTIEGVTVDIAGLRALAGVTLTVPKHGIIGVVGPNGAGKTSLLNAVCGYYPVTAGRIAFDGQPITNASTDTVSRIGIRRSFQHAPALAALTLVEYVALGFEAARPTGSALTTLPVPAAGRADRDALDRARESLADLGLDLYADRPMVDCPYAVRKLADVARAFLASPRLVLLDEPTSGVADDQRQRIAEVITARAAATGASVVVVDHDVAFVTGLCTTLVAMASGQVLDAGPSTAVLSNRAVVEAFLGTAVPAADEMRNA
jgi:ABC-type branched-subunit amino acid transport system ATPase component/ABC-type branched-subunit amino acid transport system permease subunit